MFGEGNVSDKELMKSVTKRLVRGGGGSLTAVVRQATVTLSGAIRYESQRRSMVRLVSSIVGVRRVIDELRVAPRRV